jgi:uncharacterized membrane protein
MKLLTTRSYSTVVRRLAVAGVGPLLCMGAANAQVRPATVALQIGSGAPTRVSEMARRPRHIRTSVLRADLRGDTPPSSRYYSITNVTAEVHGSTGFASAVNNDGRIVYDDDGTNGESVAYVVNNGGGVDRLSFPIAKCAYRYSAAYALNENAQAVGMYGCIDGSSNFGGFNAWALSGATGSTTAYFDQRFSYHGDRSFADAVNDSDIAVGCDGSCYSRDDSGSAVIFEPWHDAKARIIELRGLRGQSCLAAATAINNAGEIVGFDCDQAVRFSLNGYAKPLFSSFSVSSGSSAEAVNASGHVVGYCYNDNVAFLYAYGRLTVLPFPAGFDGGNYVEAAYSINASDEVVGSILARGNPTAFVYRNGRAYDLNTLIEPGSGWQIADAYAVNDHGEIVGDGYYNGALYGIALKPPR